MEISTGREVAIKILKFDQLEKEEMCQASRREILESFFQEVSILSYCNHPNIVKLLHASFEGTITKEAVVAV